MADKSCVDDKRYQTFRRKLWGVMIRHCSWKRSQGAALQKAMPLECGASAPL